MGVSGMLPKTPIHVTSPIRYRTKSFQDNKMLHARNFRFTFALRLEKPQTLFPISTNHINKLMRKITFSRILSVFAAFLLSMTLLHAQSGQVSGVVSDATGAPVVGASVIVDGTMNGTLTDENGNYTLSGVPSDGTLQFSCIGYVTRTAAVGGRAKIDMTLDEDVEMLEETVVIGYGSIKKSDLTGAVSVVDNEEFKKRSVTSIGDALQGAAAGVAVRSGGDMGGLPAIQIRGTGNLTNVDPLYIIDGVPTDNNIGFNVNDIESVQILKDASAAAIYGSRAANGVIIITTKSGQEGKTRVEFGTQVSLQHLPKLDLIGGDDWPEERPDN